MKPDRRIDQTLHVLGSAQPPEGMERRIHAHLDAAPRHFPTSYPISLAAVAAGILVLAVVLIPAGRPRQEDSASQTSVRQAQPAGAQDPARDLEQQIMARPRDSFGTASSIHVPNSPITLAPAPVGQQRGHTRSAANRPARAGGATTEHNHPSGEQNANVSTSRHSLSGTARQHDAPAPSATAAGATRQ